MFVVLWHESICVFCMALRFSLCKICDIRNFLKWIVMMWWNGLMVSLRSAFGTSKWQCRFRTEPRDVRIKVCSCVKSCRFQLAQKSIANANVRNVICAIEMPPACLPANVSCVFLNSFYSVSLRWPTTILGKLDFLSL